MVGRERLDTITLMNNLASMLWAEGELAEARKLRGEAPAILRRVLGPEHSNTSSSTWNLFRILQDLGGRDMARAILERDHLWLLGRHPAKPGADQRTIRGWTDESQDSSVVK